MYDLAMILGSTRVWCWHLTRSFVLCHTMVENRSVRQSATSTFEVERGPQNSMLCQLQFNEKTKISACDTFVIICYTQRNPFEHNDILRSHIVQICLFQNTILVAIFSVPMISERKLS